jgi:hypothetical protein
MFENVSFCQPLGAAFDSPGERGLGALSRLPRNRPNCLTIRGYHAKTTDSELHFGQKGSSIPLCQTPRVVAGGGDLRERNKSVRESGLDRKNFFRKPVRDTQ